MADPWNDDDGVLGGPIWDNPEADRVAEHAAEMVADLDPAALVVMLRQTADEFRAWHETGAFIAPPDRTHEAMLRLAAAWIEEHLSPEMAGGQRELEPARHEVTTTVERVETDGDSR